MTLFFWLVFCSHISNLLIFEDSLEKRAYRNFLKFVALSVCLVIITVEILLRWCNSLNHMRVCLRLYISIFRRFFII